MIQSCYENNSPRAVLFGIDCFVDERSMWRRTERAFGIHLLRLVAQYDDDFIFGIDAVIVIVMQLRSCDSVSGENQRRLDIRSIREGDCDEVIVDLQTG